MPTSTSVDSTFNYTSSTREKPQFFLYEPPDGTVKNIAPKDRQTSTVFNARGQHATHLDREGFSLVEHHTSVADFYDSDEVKRVYYPELIDLVRAHVAAHDVIIFDHNVRCAAYAERKTHGANYPVKFVHNDYTVASGPQRMRDLVPPSDVGKWMNSRFAIINVWRPIRGPVLESPFAFCDAQSISPQDFIPTDLVYEDRVGEIYSFHHSSAHRWYYYPEMQAHEALLLKCYDSSESGVARFTAHSAFKDPSSPDDAPPRESIEARALVRFR